MSVLVRDCKRCGHEWAGRRKEIKTCPKCKSPYWDRERERVKKGPWKSEEEPWEVSHPATFEEAVQLGWTKEMWTYHRSPPAIRGPWVKK